MPPSGKDVLPAAEEAIRFNGAVRSQLLLGCSANLTSCTHVKARSAISSYLPPFSVLRLLAEVLLELLSLSAAPLAEPSDHLFFFLFALSFSSIFFLSSSLCCGRARPAPP